MKGEDPALVDEVVRAAHEAMLAHDWDRLHLMLHPYLHWTASDGSQLRGRSATPPVPPATVELCDGQIYRWREPLSE
jgi:hypothetical protein